jgi:quercetin dioxygenase-like cupin family protein
VGEVKMAVLEQSAKAAFLVKAGEDHIGRSLYVVGSDISIKISTEDTGGAFAVFEDHTPAQAGPPLHSHRYQDEWWYILKGRYRFQVDGEIILAGPGDTVFAAKGTRHASQNIGSETGVTLTTVVPGGLDVFFAELSEAVPRGTEPNPAAVAPIFEKHDLELIGPPLAVSLGIK